MLLWFLLPSSFCLNEVLSQLMVYIKTSVGRDIDWNLILKDSRAC